MEKQTQMEQAVATLSELHALIGNMVDDTKLLNAYQRIERKLKAEIQFLQKESTRQRDKASSNLPYLYGVLNVVKQSQGVEKIICDWSKYNIVVDVICDGGNTWKKVVARNPQSLHLVWASCGQYGGKDIVQKIKNYTHAAKTESDFSPPKVVCVFTKGVTDEMADYLETNIGVSVEGERVAVSQDTLRRLQGTEDYESDESCDESDEPDDEMLGDRAEAAQTDLVTQLTMLPTHQKIFLDVTSMVIYVSDVCNGGEHFNFRDEIMAEQAEQERVTPVKARIAEYINSRKLVTCHTALENFQNFLELLGGTKEKERAKELVDKLTVVPDTVSERFQNLQKGSKIKARSKVIFGTADKLRSVILTSNEAFIRAAAAQGVSVSAVVHQSRALSELKRLEESAAP